MILFALACSFPEKAFSACTATSVQVCGVADDYETIYIDGTMVGTGNDFRFSHVLCANTGCTPSACGGTAWGVCSPVCITVTNPTILNAITANNNDVSVAAEVMNAQQNEVWGSWDIDITCNSGQHAYIQSDGTNTKLWRQTDPGAAPACTTSVEPPGTGTNWYDQGYVPSGTWVAPVQGVPADFTGGAIWSKQLYDTATGAIIPVLSYAANANSSTDCDDLYFRQDVSLVTVTPPGPPSFAINKSWLGGQPGPFPTGGPQEVTYVLNVCNSGGPDLTPVTILDGDASFYPNSAFQPTGILNHNKGIGSPPDSDGVVVDWSATTGVTVVFMKGMRGKDVLTSTNYCYAVTVANENYYIQGTQACSIYNNSASITDGTYSATSNSISVSILCPPTPTFTFTFTPTNTFTFTPTNTKTNTPTPPTTNTPTDTYTATNTNTLTFTATNTATKTDTPTPTMTDTYTPINTPTNTFTPTDTKTPTNTFTLTLTFSPTPSPTNTNTKTYTSTPTSTYTLTVTPTATNTPILTNTPTNTSTKTLTSTPTSTDTNTPIITNTFTNTATNSATSTLTKTPTNTNTITVTATFTNTTTPSNSATPSFTATNTQTYNNTPTPTNSFTKTPSSTSTYTVTITDTQTATNSATPSFTATNTQTYINSPTYTNTDTTTPTYTATNSRTSTSTATNTPVITSTFTFTPTNSFTVTNTHTPTNTATNTNTATASSTSTSTRTFTNTATSTKTWTSTFTPTPSFTHTFTPNYTPTFTFTYTPTFTWTPWENCDTFNVSKNIFNPNSESVSFYVHYCQFPGEYSLKVYNTAGELVRTIVETKIVENVIDESPQAWDGKNNHQELCADGVYIFCLTEPYDRKFRKVILLK